jgi:hypothetical protein
MRSNPNAVAASTKQAAPIKKLLIERTSQNPPQHGFLRR